MFAGIDCLEDNICAAIRVLVMAERHQRGVLTLRRVLEPEGGDKTKEPSLVESMKKPYAFTRHDHLEPYSHLYPLKCFCPEVCIYFI